MGKVGQNSFHSSNCKGNKDVVREPFGISPVSYISGSWTEERK